jgi:hypothetical protein
LDDDRENVGRKEDANEDKDDDVVPSGIFAISVVFVACGSGAVSFIIIGGFIFIACSSADVVLTEVIGRWSYMCLTGMSKDDDVDRYLDARIDR